MDTASNHHRLIILGSGPAGYSAAVYAARANLHLYTREWDAARECLDRALTLNRHQQTYTVLGRVYLMSGDVAAAVNVYKEAVK